jgi:hypothetical protein
MAGTVTKNSTEKNRVSNVRKLKMLVTVVDKSKALFYVDLLEQFEVNVQTVSIGRGTANSQMLYLLGLAESENKKKGPDIQVEENEELENSYNSMYDFE